MLCEERFWEIYNKHAEGLSFSPYRICPIGAHSDHNLGKITGFAIDKGIGVASDTTVSQECHIFTGDIVVLHELGHEMYHCCHIVVLQYQRFIPMA